MQGRGLAPHHMEQPLFLIATLLFQGPAWKRAMKMSITITSSFLVPNHHSLMQISSFHVTRHEPLISQD